jgi:hypothetical protein
MFATGGGRQTFSRRTIRKLHVFDKICFNLKFPNKKGTFDVNLVFTDIAFLKILQWWGKTAKGPIFLAQPPPPPPAG